MRWRYALHARHLDGRLALRAGDAGRALAQAQAEAEGARRHQAPKIEARALVLAGEAHLLVDARDDAAAALDEAARIAERIGYPRGGLVGLRVAAGPGAARRTRRAGRAARGAPAGAARRRHRLARGRRAAAATGGIDQLIGRVVPDRQGSTITLPSIGKPNSERNGKVPASGNVWSKVAPARFCSKLHGEQNSPLRLAGESGPLALPQPPHGVARPDADDVGLETHPAAGADDDGGIRREAGERGGGGRFGVRTRSRARQALEDDPVVVDGRRRAAHDGSRPRGIDPRLR